MGLMRALDSWRAGGRSNRMREQEQARAEVKMELDGLKDDRDDFYYDEFCGRDHTGWRFWP